MATPRPGGRTARTKAQAFEAAAALLAERDAADIAMTDIAGRAGVAATSLYRRWGDVRSLLTEMAVERLMEDSPLPDTGSLEGDLRTWGRTVAQSLCSREGSAFFRILIATAPTEDADRVGRITALGPRIQQIYDLITRALERGEPAPGVMDVTDYLLAPIYVRALFGVPADQSVADRLVDRLLAMAKAGQLVSAPP
ncbi:TetR-like C-terminal domain-containing protein [Phenylobacterium sp.]|uniref:TetR-like C-terminal domain-containing protein n=1 Tax=Phenylobacterium sp. TaxID=1871053 RepID=UPI00120AFE9F|nr:TetR-like C-terminal domain-containing protein [Phenylobacterium sp.]THD61854.1 MAG: TetR family transcriptional regulator [Phenylobacterium sp.]